MAIALEFINSGQSYIMLTSSSFIDEEGFEKPEFPFLALTIRSGGHTNCEVKSLLK
jgi:hypothetical protein